MATRIKGITIQIGADTRELQDALKGVDNSLKNTQTALKDINKLLKLDPANTDLLKQKQDELKKAIAGTENRLQILKNTYKDLPKSGTGKLTDEQKLLAREIAETEQNLKSLKEQYRDFGSVAKQQLDSVGEKLKETGDKMADVGKDLSVKLTAPIVAIGTLGVTYNAQMEQYATMFTTLTGSAEEADRIIKQLQEDAKKSPFDTDTLIKANQYLISTGVSAEQARDTINDLGNAIAATGGGNDELNRMAQNLQQIKNVGKASAADIKQFAMAGIDIYGLLADSMGTTTEKVKDMDITYEQLADALNTASQEGGKYYQAMEKQGQTLNGQMSATKTSIQQLLGAITKSAMPIINKVLGLVQKVVDWLSNLDEDTQTMILTIAAVVAAIGPALLIIGKVISTLGILVEGIGLLISPMGLVITIMAGLVAGGIALWKNWDTIKEKLGAFVTKWKNDWQQIKDYFSGVKDNLLSKVTDLVNKFRDKMSQMWQSVKDTFDKIGSWISDKFNWIISLLDKIKIKIPDIGGGGGTDDDGRYVLNARPSSLAASAGNVNINMTVNGSGISANEVAGIVVDRLTTTIKRNNQRW